MFIENLYYSLFFLSHTYTVIQAVCLYSKQTTHNINQTIPSIYVVESPTYFRAKTKLLGKKLHSQKFLKHLPPHTYYLLDTPSSYHNKRQVISIVLVIHCWNQQNRSIEEQGQKIDRQYKQQLPDNHIIYLVSHRSHRVINVIR